MRTSDLVREALDSWNLTRLAEVQSSAPGYDTRLWDELRGYVWPELGDYADMCAILEELGRICCPLPVHAGLIQVDAALAVLGEDGAAHRRHLANGGRRYAIGMHDSAGLPAPEGISVTAGHDAAGRWYLSGVVRHVTYGDSADLLLVAARAGSRLLLAGVPAGAPGLTRTTHATIAHDRLTDFHFSYTPVEAAGVLAGGGQYDDRTEAALHAAHTVGLMALCAESAGLAAGLLEATVERVTSRMAFGAPLAAMQSVQLRVGDMYLDLTAARLAVTELAGLLATEPAHELMAMAAAAKLTVTAAALRVAAAAHQLGGGWGQLDEAGLHHYTRAIKAAEGQLGTPEYHRKTIARLLAENAL